MKNKVFTPLIFLASLGAGGVAIIPFALLQYTVAHEKGLIKMSDLNYDAMSGLTSSFFHSLEAIMIVFIVIHIVLSVIFFKKLTKFVKSENYQNFISDPLKNSAILAPFISIVMTMNVFIGPVRYFLPAMSANLQGMMLPALLFWIFLWAWLMKVEIKLLKTSFEKGFDMSKITFGWLLHPFALGMMTVTGTGIAAMAENPSIAHTAVFLSLVSGTMGLFLLIVKTISVFQRHFNSQEGLGEKQFLPSFLIVVPNITLYAISIFRFGHYLEKHHHMHLDSYFLIVMTVAFAFETWYMLFGLALLKDYFTKHHFKSEHYVTQWGLICPFVAYAVLGSFVYNVFVQSQILYGVIIISTIIAIVLFFDLLIRYIKCNKKAQIGFICE